MWVAVWIFEVRNVVMALVKGGSDCGKGQHPLCILNLPLALQLSKSSERLSDHPVSVRYSLCIGMAALLAVACTGLLHFASLFVRPLLAADSRCPD